MTDNIIKIQAEQSGFDTSGNKQVVDIRIEEGENINLSESYIAIDIAANASCSNNAQAIYDDKIVFNDSTKDAPNNDNRHDPSILVKHASARGSRSGMIESLRNIDVLNSALSLYNKNYNEKEELNGFTSQNARSLIKTNPQNELYGEGNEVSRKRNHEVRIPLKQIFNFCNTENYDSVKHGALHLHFELNLDRISNGVSLDGYNTRGKFGTTVPATRFARCDDVQITDAVERNTLVTTVEYVDLIDSPFYVGEPIIVKYKKDAGGQTTAAGTKIITDIRYQKAADGQPVNNNKLELVLSEDWSDGGGNATYTEIDVLLDGGDAGTVGNVVKSLVVNKVELTAVVNRVDVVRNQPLVYSTIVSQEDSYPAVNNIQRNYDIPAFTKNIYVAFNTRKISHAPNFALYRISADGEYVTGSRTVKPHSPKHYEFLSAVFKNNAKTIHGLNDLIPTIRHSKSGADAYTSITLLAVPVKFLPRPQKITLELEAATGSTLQGKHILYSEVIRQVE